MAELSSYQIEKIRRNHHGGDVTAAALLDLFQHRVASGAERAVRELVRRMTEDPHFNRREHTEGSRDQTPHVTIWVNGRGHHLRLDSHGVVFQVTEVGGDVGTVPPWVRPGG